MDIEPGFSLLSAEERLSVSAVLQRVKIEVNEEGTKAAAASGKLTPGGIMNMNAHKRMNMHA